MKGLFVCLLPIAFLACTKESDARSRDQSTTRPDLRAPDDTGVNKRDRDNRTLTPMDQSNEPADLDLTKRIRQALTEDSSLSTNAKNVKVITIARVVTLRGPVKTQAEKDAVLAKARAQAGDAKVVDELEVSGR